MWGTFLASLRVRLRLLQPRRCGLVGILATAAVAGCGKERPFASGTSPLQPEVETPADAAPGSENSQTSDDCRVLGCEADRVCDPSSGLCVGCRTAGDCTSPETPVCETATQACVQCLANSDCSGPAPLCKLGAGEGEPNRCVECTSDAACSDDRPACDPNANECTARCTASAQCGPPTPICNASNQICVGCLASTDCAGTADECDPATSRCVQCLDDSGCTDGQVCNGETHTCVECLDTAQCLDPLEAHCQLDTNAAEARFTCAGCVEDRDCIGKPGLGGVCRPNDARCVECVADSQCADDPAASNCSMDGTCVACASNADCFTIPGRLACVPGIGCAECVAANDCAGNANGPVCKLSNTGRAEGDAPTNTCVECTSSTDCTNPTGSRCQNNVCVPCTENADCALDNGSLDVCDEGTCVECTGTQRAACGANVCDSQNKVCSILAAGTADTCEPCISDSQCASEARCVRQVVAGTDLGFFCIPLATGSPPTCGRVFVEVITSNTIEGIAPEVVCQLRRTTCEGFNDFNRFESCTVDDDCGVSGIADGVCNEQLGRCAIPCASGLDCFASCDLLEAACEL